MEQKLLDVLEQTQWNIRLNALSRNLAKTVRGFDRHLCVDCGKRLKTRTAKRCRSCNMKLHYRARIEEAKQ